MPTLSGVLVPAESLVRRGVAHNAVADAVPDLGDLRVKTSIDAFGEALPMACDETPIGRQINRRVEEAVADVHTVGLASGRTGEDGSR